MKDNLRQFSQFGEKKKKCIMYFKKNYKMLLEETFRRKYTLKMTYVYYIFK